MGVANLSGFNIRSQPLEEIHEDKNSELEEDENEKI